MIGSPEPETKLPVALLALRVGVFIVMIVWTLDKFVNPVHAARVFDSFYGLAGLGTPVIYAIGAIQLVFVIGFLAGVARRWTYGAVLLMHTVSTLASWPKYIQPFEGGNLLFFAAWPMLAACVALYVLRDEDRLLSLKTP